MDWLALERTGQHCVALGSTGISRAPHIPVPLLDPSSPSDLRTTHPVPFLTPFLEHKIKSHFMEQRGVGTEQWEVQAGKGLSGGIPCQGELRQRALGGCFVGGESLGGCFGRCFGRVFWGLSLGRDISGGVLGGCFEGCVLEELFRGGVF